MIHDPSRLAILTALGYVVADAGLKELVRLTGLTKGNVSVHLSKLEAADLVKANRRFVGRKPVTTTSLTEEGRDVVEEHWSKLERLRLQARAWSKGEAAHETENIDTATTTKGGGSCRER